MRVQVRTEYRKEHIAEVNCVNPTSPEFYLQCFSLHRAILEVLSNQCRSKKIGDDETKETEPNVLQRQRNKGAKS